MRRLLITGLFVFSVVLNIVVGATMAWNLWSARSPHPIRDPQRPELSSSDFERIRALWSGTASAQLREKRGQILEKKAQLLDIVAKDPDDVKAAQMALNELVVLGAQAEKQALDEVRQIMMALPQDKKQAFLNFLKTRACMGPGMGPGYGRGRHRMGPRYRGYCPMPGAAVGE